MSEFEANASDSQNFPSPIAERAISDALRAGKALLKFISRNDVGATGGHQCGYYLPKDDLAWPLFTPNPPIDGQNSEHLVEVLWQDGRVTHSCAHWYGRHTRSEYRLTRFGRDFPWLQTDSVGDLLILIPKDEGHLLGYVLDRPVDINEFQAALGIDLLASWALYDGTREPAESEDACLATRFQQFAAELEAFPPTREFASFVHEALEQCIPASADGSADDLLMRWLEEEYRLFRQVERTLCLERVTTPFKDMDDFLATASSILNRRKARAGKSLEHHFEYLLEQADIPFDPKPWVDNTNPDIVIPGKRAYDDRSYPPEKIIVIGLKRTCKDRWRQVVNEAPRIPIKYIVTTQQGISARQLAEMGQRNINLVVPSSIREAYPKTPELALYSIQGFLERIRTVIE